MIKRQSASAPSGLGSLAAKDDAFSRRCPLMFEYLTATTFEDGSERQTATLLVFAAEGVWKGCLNDRAEEQALWASASDLQGVLDALEHALETGAPDWRRTSSRKSGGRR
jgi:hypothetical protein